MQILVKLLNIFIILNELPFLSNAISGFAEGSLLITPLPYERYLANT